MYKGMKVRINCKDKDVFFAHVRAYGDTISKLAYGEHMIPYHGLVGEITEVDYLSWGNGKYHVVEFEDGESFYWPQSCLEDLTDDITYLQDKVIELESIIENAKKALDETNAQIEKAYKNQIAKNILPGSVFKWRGEHKCILIHLERDEKWLLCGLDGNMFIAYSNSPMTTDELIAHLIMNEYSFAGMAKAGFDF